MKKIYLLISILISATLTFSQSADHKNGIKYFEAGLYDSAIIAFTNVLKVNSNSKVVNVTKLNIEASKKCSAKLKQADADFNSHFYAKAKDLYNGILKENPNDKHVTRQIEKCNSILKKDTHIKSSNSKVVFPGAGGIEILTITTDADSWDFKDLPTWCSASKTGNTLKLVCLKNDKSTSRDASFTVFTNNNWKTINLEQSGATVSSINQNNNTNNYSSKPLSISQQSLTFYATNNEAKYVNISNIKNDYTVYGVPTWLDIVKYNDYIKIDCKDNRNSNLRKDWFVIKSGTEEVRIYVEQSASINYSTNSNKSLNASTQNITFNAKNNESKHIALSNIKNNFSLYGVPSWLEIVKFSDYIKIICRDNNDKSPRNDWFSIKSGADEVRIYVEQLGTTELAKSAKTKKQSYFAIGYEGGEIAKYGIRLDFGGENFTGGFANIRTSFIRDINKFKEYENSLPNKNEFIVGPSFKLTNWMRINIGAGYGYYEYAYRNDYLNTLKLERQNYVAGYGGITFKIANRVNISAGASFIDIDKNTYKPEFTGALTINLLKNK